MLGKALWGSLIITLAGLSAYAGAIWWAERSTGPTVLTVAAGPRGSDAYDLLSELAEVLERQSDTVRLKVIESRDSSTNIALLMGAADTKAGNPEDEARRVLYERLATDQSGAVARADLERADPPTAPPVEAVRRVDLATIHADTPTPAAIRLIAPLFQDHLLLLTRADSGLNTIDDLIGRPIALPENGSDEQRAFFALIDHHRLNPLGLKWQGMPLARAIKAMTDKTIDGIFVVRSIRDRSVAKLIDEMALTRAGRLHVVPIDQAAAMALKRPYLLPTTIVKGAFEGASPGLPPDAISSVAMRRLLVAREDVDADALQEFSRVLFEARLDLTTRFPLASEITRPDTAAALVLPIHEGTDAYLRRDEPTFLQENAELVGVAISVVALMGSGLLAVRSRVAGTLKNRADSYNYALLAIRDQATNAADPASLAACRQELAGVLDRVVVALDKDEITEEGFQSFSLVWTSVRDAIRDRDRELARASDA